jgi:O-antigen/teichoic acid export membrane protein
MVRTLGDSPPSRSIARDSVFLFLSTLFNGAVSYALFFVAARVLDARTLSSFLTIWAVTNTALLALTIPVDTYSPRFRLECEKRGISAGDRLLLLSAYSLGAGIAVGALPFVGLVVGLLNMSAGPAVAIALFALASAAFSSKRAFVTSNGAFHRYLGQTIVFSVLGMACLGVVLAIKPNQQAWLYLTLAAANVGGAASVARGYGLVRRARRGTLRRSWPFVREVQALPTMSHLVFVTLVTVTLTNGSLMFAKVIGTSSPVIVSYAAAVNLVMIPFTALNSFSGPIHNRFVRSIAKNDLVEVWHDYIVAAVWYLVAVVVVSFGALLGLRRLIGLYAGGKYSLSSGTCLGVSAAEGLATVGALPRALLVALGQARRVTPTWVAGLMAFGGVLILPVSALTRLVVAPGTAALVILVLSTLQIRRTLANA